MNDEFQVFGIDFFHFDIAVQQDGRRLLQLDALSPLSSLFKELGRLPAGHARIKLGACV